LLGDTDLGRSHSLRRAEITNVALFVTKLATLNVEPAITARSQGTTVVVVRSTLPRLDSFRVKDRGTVPDIDELDPRILVKRLAVRVDKVEIVEPCSVFSCKLARSGK
jgi:hypothetical protein